MPNINTEMSGRMNDTNEQAYWEFYLGFTFYPLALLLPSAFYYLALCAFVSTGSY